MRTLLLSGYGVNLNVDAGKLIVKDGRSPGQEPIEYAFKPKFIDIDSIMIYGHSGNISLDAMKWLAKMDVQLSVLNWDGRLLYSLMPPEIKQTRTRMAQYETYRDEKKRLIVAKALIEAKISSSIVVLDWLKKRYSGAFDDHVMAKIEELHALLPNTKTLAEIRGIEGMVARCYFDLISSIFPEKLEFTGRTYGNTQRPMGAVDPINALFNYGYAVLESQCLKAAYSAGFDPGIGFLHEMAPGSAPLVYDLQEPFRWMVDITIIEALEKKAFGKKDFMLTENYNLRIRPEGVKKLIGLLDARFTSKTPYKGKNWEWGYVIASKTGELARYLEGNRKAIDFANPSPNLRRDDTESMRSRILDLSFAEWRKNGFSKGTLHELKKKAKSEEPFKIYSNVKEKLAARL